MLYNENFIFPSEMSFQRKPESREELTLPGHYLLLNAPSPYPFPTGRGIIFKRVAPYYTHCSPFPTINCDWNEKNVLLV